MASAAYQPYGKYNESLRESADGPQITGAGTAAAAPAAATNMTTTSKRSLQPAELVTEAAFPYSNGADSAPPSTRAAYTDRHNSMNSTMTGRYYDRMSSQSLLGAKRPRPHKIWKKKFIKVLVVGDSGLGKTTLIRTLLSTPTERVKEHDGTSTSSEQFRRDPDSLCTLVTWQDEEDRVVWVYRIQDTPGYGDDLNIMHHIAGMLGFITKQNEAWLALESSRERRDDLAEVDDPRVDVCLFCLPPHRLRPVDIRYMYELGKVVPVIPIITKADTMTIREATVYREEVASKLEHSATAGVPGVRGRINLFQFARDTLERAGLGDVGGGRKVPPFAVIASNDINEDMNAQEPAVYWPERRYPWGTAEAFNPDHSDLLQLRALLLKEALEDIAKDKRARYERWRSRVLGGVKLGRKLRNLLLFCVVPVTAGVYVGSRGIDLPALAAHAAAAARAVKGRLAPEGAPAAAEAVKEPEPEARRTRNWF